MYMDRSLRIDTGVAGATLDFGDVQATYNGTEFDCGAAGAYAGMELHIRVTEAAASAGAPTFTFQLEHGTTSGFGSGNEVLYQSKAYAKAALAINTIIWKIILPSDHLRYIRINCVVGTANATAGVVESYLVLDRQSIE